ncbi:MAG: DUF4878 domain-containing protein, partial [Flavobacterium sp.]
MTSFCILPAIALLQPSINNIAHVNFSCYFSPQNLKTVMMKKILFALVLVSGTLLFSCKSGGGDPKSVLADFFSALSKKDMAKARTFATEDSKTMLDMMEMGMKMAKDSAEDKKFAESNLTYGEVKIDGDKATVPVTEKTSGETVNYILKKEKGNWKVAFDKE